jgi:hypothetical protein
MIVRSLKRAENTSAVVALFILDFDFDCVGDIDTAAAITHCPVMRKCTVARRTLWNDLLSSGLYTNVDGGLFGGIDASLPYTQMQTAAAKEI